MTRLIHTCEITHSYMRHDSFICVTWLIHMCVTLLIHICDMTHSYVWHDSFRRVWRVSLISLQISDRRQSSRTMTAGNDTNCKHLWLQVIFRKRATNYRALCSHPLEHTSHRRQSSKIMTAGNDTWQITTTTVQKINAWQTTSTCPRPRKRWQPRPRPPPPAPSTRPLTLPLHFFFCSSHCQCAWG